MASNRDLMPLPYSDTHTFLDTLNKVFSQILMVYSRLNQFTLLL